MMKGNEKDCICEKQKGKHRKYCDAFRFYQFIKKCNGVNIKKVKKINKQ
jgi:hypothetical protein